MKRLMITFALLLGLSFLLGEVKAQNSMDSLKKEYYNFPQVGELNFHARFKNLVLTGHDSAYIKLYYGLTNYTSQSFYKAIAPGSGTFSFPAVTGLIPGATYKWQLRVYYPFNQKGDSGTFTVPFCNYSLSVDPTSDTMCVGGNASFYATVTGGVSPTYSWAPPATLTGANTPFIVATPNTTTSYTLTVADAGCTTTANVTAVVLPQPTVTATANPKIICLNSSSMLTATGTPGLTYTWWPGGLSGSSITVTPSLTTIYTAYGSNGYCTGIDTAKVTVSGSINGTITGNSTICYGSSKVLTAGGGTGYLWSTGATTASITVTPSDTTIYSVTITNSIGCFVVKQTTVNVNHVVVFGAENFSVCPGISDTIHLTGAATYSWVPTTGLTILSGGATVYAHPTTNTTYTITGNLSGCTGTVNISGTVFVPDTTKVSVDQDTVCSGTQIILTGSGVVSYNWNQGLGSGNPMLDTLNVTTNYVVTGTDIHGCTSSASIVVHAIPLPVMSFVTPIGGIDTICVETFSSVVINGGDAISFSWYPTNGLGNTIAPTNEASPASSTIYTVTGTNNAGCSSAIALGITVVHPPIISSVIVSPSSTTINGSLPDPIYLKVNGTIHNTNFQNTSQAIFPLLSLSNGDNLKVEAKGTDGNCYTNWTYTGISEINTANISVGPNPFTDVLYVNIPNFGQYKISLFNESGQIISDFYSEQSFKLSKNNFSAGIYLLQIVSGNEIILLKKIIVR